METGIGQPEKVFVLGAENNESIPNRTPSKEQTLLGGFFLLSFSLSAAAWAGPPFQTDDPEPVEYGHWEIFFAAAYIRVPGIGFGTGPQFDINYGFVPEAHVNLVCPFAFNSPDLGT